MRTTPVDQSGLAALTFVLVLLFTMSLALLWTGRGLLFEQRAAANQQRQAAAFAAAESGLAWAWARLNDPRAIDARCAATASGASFRDRYAAPWVTAPDMTAAVDTPATHTSRRAASGYAPPTGLHAACRIDAAEIACGCSALPPNATSADSERERPSFAIELNAVDGDAQALWLTARGCSGAWTDCATAVTAQTEAQAVVRVQLRLVDDATSQQPGSNLQREVHALRTGPLALVPGSWRDGHCTASALHEPCGFEP